LPNAKGIAHPRSHHFRREQTAQHTIQRADVDVFSEAGRNLSDAINKRPARIGAKKVRLRNWLARYASRLLNTLSQRRQSVAATMIAYVILHAQRT